MQEAIDEIGWIGQLGKKRRYRSKNGSNRSKICLKFVVTPESLHLLLGQKNHERFFKEIKTIVVDEWHELRSKRGVMVELGISQLTKYVPKMKIWGITATIGNLDEAWMF
jgi:ATP-dependent Lhr-like helicase